MRIVTGCEICLQLQNLTRIWSGLILTAVDSRQFSQLGIWNGLSLPGNFQTIVQRQADVCSTIIQLTGWAYLRVLYVARGRAPPLLSLLFISFPLLPFLCFSFLLFFFLSAPFFVALKAMYYQGCDEKIFAQQSLLTGKSVPPIFIPQSSFFCGLLSVPLHLTLWEQISAN